MRFFMCLSLLALISCAEDKKNTETSEDSTQNAAQASNSFNVEEDSERKLDELIASLRSLEEASKNSDGDYTLISQHAASLATHLEFEVAPHVAKQQYRDASYDWDFGELYATRLENAFTSNPSAQTNLADQWASYQELREVLLNLKKRWNRR